MSESDRREAGRIVGLTGRNAAGKGTVAELLGEAGFAYFSLSDAIRDELKARGLEETRAHLTDVGNDLRARHGAAVLAERIADKLHGGADFVVDSIRNPAEVHALRAAHSHFRLWYVDASAATRFERLRTRNRAGDVATYEEFVAQEARELETDDPSTQQLLATEALADVRVPNDGSVDDLRETVSGLLRPAP